MTRQWITARNMAERREQKIIQHVFLINVHSTTNSLSEYHPFKVFMFFKQILTRTILQMPKIQLVFSRLMSAKSY